MIVAQYCKYKKSFDKEREDSEIIQHCSSTLLNTVLVRQTNLKYVVIAQKNGNKEDVRQYPCILPIMV